MCRRPRAGHRVCARHPRGALCVLDPHGHPLSPQAQAEPRQLLALCLAGCRRAFGAPPVPAVCRCVSLDPESSILNSRVLLSSLVHVAPRKGHAARLLNTCSPVLARCRAFFDAAPVPAVCRCVATHCSPLTGYLRPCGSYQHHTVSHTENVGHSSNTCSHVDCWPAARLAADMPSPRLLSLQYAMPVSGPEP